MCGIAGRVNVAAPVSTAQVRAMSSVIAPRGPDGEGIWRDTFDPRAVLAHRRLAIVDRAGGAQPAVSERGEVVLVYNGEVYNHEALRADLEARGHRFASRCDTEAILHAHEELGWEAAARLRGMFAYAAWEPGPRRLTLVRDRLGIKPIYYAELPSGDLLFASDLRALLVEPEVDRTIDEDALDAYLALRYVPAPATILSGVRKLEPGCALVWQGGRSTVKRWWSVPVEAGPSPPTEIEAGGRLCELLDEVVELRRMADVPLGAFLSGGLDSTLVTAILARRARASGLGSPCTFAVGFDDAPAEGDEREFARRAAAELGTCHHEIVVTRGDVAHEIARIARDLDEPVADPAAVPLWFLSRRAREEVTVVLSGEGGDEVFAGYARYGHAIRANRLRRLRGAATAARLLGPHLPGRYRRAAALVADAPERAYRGVSRAFDDAGGDAVERLLAHARARAGMAPSTLARLLAFDQQVWLPDDLLVKADKTTMAHALELRVPLLDHVMLEEVSAWPDEWKHDGTQGKLLLRRAAEGMVPAFVLDRPKTGFATPSSAWLRGPLAAMARDLLGSNDSVSSRRGHRARVDRLFDEHSRGEDRGAELWSLFWLELWRREVQHAAPAREDDFHSTPAWASHAGP
jgi:asparagine synthase (glutamine-hydrolysing)